MAATKCDLELAGVLSVSSGLKAPRGVYLSQAWKNKLAKQLTNGWGLAGILTLSVMALLAALRLRQVSRYEEQQPVSYLSPPPTTRDP